MATSNRATGARNTLNRRNSLSLRERAGVRVIKNTFPATN